MANVDTTISDAPQDSLWKRVLDAIARSMDAQANVSARRNMIETLEAKSDAELARMGLRRDDIAYHVFKDLFYT